MAYNKYSAKPTIYNGKKFPSIKEANYCKRLDISMKATSEKERVIKYEMQVPFEVVVSGAKICKYLLDFKVYYADGSIEFIDVKGVKTPVYRIKKKLVEAIHGIKIIEV
jgi:hypothetical protein